MSAVSRRHQVRSAKKALRAQGIVRPPVISRRRHQRLMNAMQVEPWRLLLSVDVGVSVAADELRDMFQDDDLGLNRIETENPFDALDSLDAVSANGRARPVVEDNWTQIATRAPDAVRLTRLTRASIALLKRLLVSETHRCDSLVALDRELFELSASSLAVAAPAVDAPGFSHFVSSSSQLRAAVYAMARFYDLDVFKPAPDAIHITPRLSALPISQVTLAQCLAERTN